MQRDVVDVPRYSEMDAPGCTEMDVPGCAEVCCAVQVVGMLIDHKESMK